MKNQFKMEDFILSRYENEKRILFREEPTTTDQSQLARRKRLKRFSPNHIDRQLELSPASAKSFFKPSSPQSSYSAPTTPSTTMINFNHQAPTNARSTLTSGLETSSSSSSTTVPHHPMITIKGSSTTRERRRTKLTPRCSLIYGLVNPIPLLLLIIVSTSSFCTAVDDFITANNLVAQQQQQQQQQPRAEAITMTRNNDKQQDSSSDVIIIKYANVTNKDSSETTSSQEDDTLSQQIELNLFKLNEPLSVSVIESKFAHSIQLFDVSHNQLSTLSKDLFCPLSNEVRQLNISYNLLENFDCLGLISQAGQLCLSELRVLDMSYNLIKHLPATGVATLHNLEILNLSHNLIESLDELSLSSLVKLTKLDLSSNRIQQLPVRIFHKSLSMQVLKLQSNYLQISISHMFLQGLDSLEEINLSFNNISHLSDLAFSGKVNLTRVDLTHNQLSTLRQEALKVTSVKQENGFRHRLHHNGQYAGVAPKQTHSQAASSVFLLSSNPFICDCQLDWLRKFQPSSAIKRTVLSSSSINNNNRLQLSEQASNDQLGAQLMQLAASSSNIYQNDQPPVISASSSSDSSNNNSEIISNQQQQSASDTMHQQQLNNRPMATLLTSSGTQHQQQQQQQFHQHYARIGDLDLIKCTPLFRRNTQRNQHHFQHDKQQANFHRHGGSNNGQLRSSAPSDGTHLSHQQHHHHLYQQSNTKQHQQETMIDLLGADSSNFLCGYKSHCFALCQCCEFDACDCEMICPTGCNCYYDLTWQTNIIDCSSNNHTVVPDRIPMDVSGLHLDGNDIVSLKPSNLIARKSLKTLYLNSSNLQYIANRTFNGLIELQTLYLHDNMLRSLNGYEFEPLAKLKALYLQSNRLDHISNQTFIYLRSLEVLDLSNNRLTSANLDLFWSIGHHNIRLRQLNIAHNWWSCQCNSINRFRQILKQKFLLNGSVNIADKNQLRCYYNATTVGPLILADGVAGSNALQQPLYASYPASSSSLSSSSSAVVGGSRQQTLLTEINQCSEIIDDTREPGNPPIIDVVTEFPSITPANEFPNDPYYSPDPNDLLRQPNSREPANPDSSMYNQPTPVVPADLNLPNFDPNANSIINGRQPVNSSGSSMPLTSFILLSMLSAVILVISVSIFVFIRQQQQSHHKKSSAASTTSGSSSASSTAISSLNRKAHHQHHQHHHHQRNQHHVVNHQTMHNPHHHQQHHHLIMSNGTNTITNHLHHQSLHHHSASSQSNIYAALVSPSTGNSTTLTNQINSNGNNNNLISANHNNNNNNNSTNNNNLYSNSSTTASHHSNSSQGQHGVYPQHWPPLMPGYQHSVYNQPYASNNGGTESHYAINASASQSSYKTGGSLYNAPGNCHGDSSVTFGANLTGQPGDWIKLPKVKQFMSKLVNKSLAIGGYRSCSRDELSAITSDKIYDAFISYDKRDEAFVMQHLSAELEYGQPQYRVADRYRDLPLPSSSYIAEAITSVIGCSHRTIMVLTENYLASEWCRYELQAALREASLDKSHKIIAVVLDPKCLLEMDSEMRALLTNSANNVSIYQSSNQQSPQLVQLEGANSNNNNNELQQQQQLIATLTNQSGAHQQVSTQTAQLATSRITFINYNERKFWPKFKQLMPTPRPSTQTLTLTTKN